MGLTKQAAFEPSLKAVRKQVMKMSGGKAFQTEDRPVQRFRG